MKKEENTSNMKLVEIPASHIYLPSYCMLWAIPRFMQSMGEEEPPPPPPSKYQLNLTMNRNHECDQTSISVEP